jgi:hypothetical protein
MYCHMLERYRLELATPIQEADEFFNGMEAQIDSFVLGAIYMFHYIKPS